MYIDIEFGVEGGIPHPFLIGRRGDMGKSATNRTTHDAQSLDMLGNVWEGSEQQCYVRQGSGSYQPWSSWLLSKQPSSHRQNSICMSERWT